MARTAAHPAKGTSSIATFETEFERLTGIVDRLEEGNVPLGEMLKLYEEGMGLATSLKDVLAQAELRVEKLAAVHEELVASERSGVAAGRQSSESVLGTESGETDSESDADLLF